MTSSVNSPLKTVLQPLAGLLVAATMLAGCVTAAGVAGAPGSSTSPGSSDSPVASGSASPLVSPAGSSSASGFYLRAWQTQALAPQYEFGGLPGATIADGKFIDGMIAIPTIYPGPIYIGLSTRAISAAGIDAIVAEAERDGLLGSKTDFSTGPLAGAVTAHITLIVNGVTHDLTGSLPGDGSTSASAPATPAAFEAFWNRVTSIDTWLTADLGTSESYTPTSVGVMLTPPVDAPKDFTVQEKPWPLPGTFAKFGSAMGVAPYRCGVVTGADLATLLPVVQDANQLTRFVDSTKAKVGLQVEVLLPGEPSPCD
jgi:hypothetical protein